MSHIEKLLSVYPVAGRDVADVGAGDGTFSAQLDAAGARVTGIEIDEAKVAAAAAKLPASVTMRVGRAEALPLDDGSMDLMCFFFSFHHVPMAVQSQALDEVRRVLRPGGRLHVVEPYPHGAMFEVGKWVEDETGVRTNSHRIMSDLGARPPFREIARLDYTLTRGFADFDAYVKRSVSINPARAALFPAVEATMRAAFERNSVPRDGLRELDQPCCAYHFEVA